MEGCFLQILNFSARLTFFAVLKFLIKKF
uniref:Uncharacterized protein n=1 Tax=Anguilla anguilla TaxID=7936 RepID=A0A0E9RHC8_ANGAN